MSMNVKKGDTVVVLSGKDKGKQGEESTIVRREAPLYASKVQVVCPKCSKATRVGHKVEKKTVAGKEKNVSVRVCKKCGAEI